MNYSVRKTIPVAMSLVIAAAVPFCAYAASETPADAFRSMGSDVTSADIPDMSGDLFAETPSDAGAGTSVEMPGLDMAASDNALPDAGNLNAGAEDLQPDGEKKDTTTSSSGTSTPESLKTDNPFASLGDSVVGNLSFDADGYLSQLMGDSYGGLNSSLFNMEMPDVSFESLNSQFAQMKASMDLKTSGISMELPEFKLNTVSASNAKDLFGQTYGGLTSGMGVKNYSIPSSFNADAFLQQGFTAQDNAKKAYEGLPSFKNANSYIGGASDIVKEATSQLSTKSAFDRADDIKKKANANKSLISGSMDYYTLDPGSEVDTWVNGKKKDIQDAQDTDYNAALAEYERKKAEALKPDEDDGKKGGNPKTPSGGKTPSFIDTEDDILPDGMSGWNTSGGGTPSVSDIEDDILPGGTSGLGSSGSQSQSFIDLEDGILPPSGKKKGKK